MHPTQHLASAFVHANSAHQHIVPADAENQRRFVQDCLSTHNVPVKADVSNYVLRHPSGNSAILVHSVISPASAHPECADQGTSGFTTSLTGTGVSGPSGPRPSLTDSIDSGVASLDGDAHNGRALNTSYRPVRGVKCERRLGFVAPNVEHRGQASLTAKWAAAAVLPSQRLLTYLMADVLARDGELGSDCHPQEAASALKAMAIGAETTLRALEKENGVNNEHCTFIASLHRCGKVLGALDDLHGYSRRSKHSSRRLIVERTCTALQGIQKRYDASRQILIDAHDKRPHYEVHAGDVDILLHQQNVIDLMRQGAGKSIAERRGIAEYQARLLEVQRRFDADYAETVYRL